MAELELRDINNQKVGMVQLAPEIFGAKVRKHLVQKYVDYQLAGARRGTAATKQCKREIRGSGKKPWRQKGTGRARCGTTRSPLWRGGLTLFGPTPRSFAFAMTKKTRRLALISALSERAQTDGLAVVDRIAIEKPRTKDAVAYLRKMGFPGKTLFLLAERDRNLELAVRNIPDVNVLLVDGLNVFDLLYHEKIVLTQDALKKIEERLN
jgi:large subunit ribosomal protein L4